MIIKRGFSLLALLALFVLPLASAEIVITQQPGDVYNLGDIATIKVTFRPAQAVTGNFQMDLLCGANTVNFYKNGMSVPAGDERVIESSLILQRDVIGENKGTCSIRAYFSSDSTVTEDFLISDGIEVNATLSKTELSPGESILIKGKAVKENGKAANGYVDVLITEGNSTIESRKGTVNNGDFTTNITIPEGLKSGNYILKISVYEEDLSAQLTNNGFQNQGIFVKQVPTSLEIVFENSGENVGVEVLPGEALRVKAVLHDQTGVTIDSLVFLTIKNSKNKIMEQTELPTDEFLEFPIAYNEAPSSWKVVAVSNKLTSEATFLIPEKESAEIKIENKTVFITNTGNIPYNKTVLVKIGNQSMSIDVYLSVGSSQRWLLTAPDGEYDVSVLADGEETISSGVALTGNAIDIRKASAGIGSLTKFPAVWVFMIAVLGIMTFIVFKRGYQKAFIGYITGAQKRTSIATEGSGAFGITPKGRAEMVLSIKGDKQETSVIALKIKNMAWIKNVKEGSTSEVLEKAMDIAEGYKAATYETGDFIFYLFAPVRTKTFRNEEAALKATQKIKEMLDHHNKMFKQKIDFGISLNLGEIIAKQDLDTGTLKFMGLGSLMNHSKKIASIAQSNILMSEKITDRLKTMVKTEKHKHDGIDTYSIKEIRDTEKHEKFLKGFMKRQGEEK